MTMPDKTIQEWMNEQMVGDEMLWKGAWGHQLKFLRDEFVMGLCGAGIEYYRDREEIARVISTHRSKSIDLPVVEVSRPDLGLRMIVRNNFYNWKLSVVSEKPIEVDFSGLFHTTPPIDPAYTGDSLASCYFEGFPQDRIFGYFSKSNRKFSADIGNNNELCIVTFLILRHLGAIKACEWSTAETYPQLLKDRSAREEARRAERKAQGLSE